MARFLDSFSRGKLVSAMFTPLTFCYSTCQCTTPKNTRVDPDVPRVFHCTHARLSSSFHLLRVRLILPDWELFFFFLIYTLQWRDKKKSACRKKKSFSFFDENEQENKTSTSNNSDKNEKEVISFHIQCAGLPGCVMGFRISG